MNKTTKSYFFALLAIMFWSTAAVAFKIALKYMDFIHLLFFASLTSFFALIWIHLILGENIYNTTIAGLIFIILGIFVHQFWIKKI